MQEVEDFLQSISRLTVFCLSCKDEEDEIEEFAISLGATSLPSLVSFVSGEMKSIQYVRGVNSFREIIYELMVTTSSLPSTLLSSSSSSEVSTLFVAGDRWHERDEY